MQLSHAPRGLPRGYRDAFEGLHKAVERAARRARRCDDFQSIEEHLHRCFMEAECEVLSELLSHYDIDLPVLNMGEKVYRRALRCEERYMSAAGPVRVMRTLYRDQRNAPTMCPLEGRVGMVEGRWTPRAAKLASELVATMTPGEAEGLLKSFGGMQPSKSSLDRLPKQLSERWEGQREAFEHTLRGQDRVPEAAVAMAVSLDGVLVPTRYAAVLPGDSRWAEASCGSVSFYDAQGEVLATRYYARMPEHHKRTLKSQLLSEVNAVLASRPDLKLVKVADGARDNWSFFTEALPQGIEVLDFYHAAQHLKSAMDAIHGQDTRASRQAYDKYRDILLNDAQGVIKIIRHLRYQLRKRPKKALKRELTYFTRHQKRCTYAALKAQYLPIGSGVVEAACKSVVQQRLKRSGMRWDSEGGQAVLNFRTLLKSERFDAGWHLLAQTYRTAIEPPANVLKFRPK